MIREKSLFYRTLPCCLSSFCITEGLKHEERGGVQLPSPPAKEAH